MGESLNTWIESTQALLADNAEIADANEHGNLGGREFVKQLPQMLSEAERLAESSTPTSISPGKAAAAKSSRTAPDPVGKSFDAAAAKAHEAFTYGTTGKRK